MLDPEVETLRQGIRDSLSVADMRIGFEAE